MRYFRAESAEVYEAVRAHLDAAYGYPSEATKTATAICPAAESPTDTNGRVYMIASEAECEFPAVAALLPQLLASGLAEEVDSQQFTQSFPTPF